MIIIIMEIVGVLWPHPHLCAHCDSVGPRLINVQVDMVSAFNDLVVTKN